MIAVRRKHVQRSTYSADGSVVAQWRGPGHYSARVKDVEGEFHVRRLAGRWSIDDGRARFVTVQEALDALCNRFSCGTLRVASAK